MQFQFRLTPVAEINPWGADQGRPSLHWYGLTDGWFWIEAGGQELFRYTEEVLHHWHQQVPEGCLSPLPYENYQVARYWEDLLELLPAILDPLPPDLVARVADARGWSDLQSRALRWQEVQASETAWDAYYMAAAWWGRRTWDAGHLAHPPCIALWRVEDTVHIRWDNRQVTVNGAPVWEALEDEVTLPVAEFLAAVESFHRRFSSEMERRVAEVTAEPPLHVEIDLVALLLEQEERHGLLQSALRPGTTEAGRDYSWDEVRAALAVVERGTV